MKKIGYFLLAAFLLIVLAGGMSCQSKTQYTTATPEGTVRAFLQAYSQLDAKKVAEFWIESERKEVCSQMDELFKQFKSITISNIKTEVLSQTEDTAKIRIQYYLTSTTKEGVSQSWYIPQEINYQLDLAKQDSKWLIRTAGMGR